MVLTMAGQVLPAATLTQAHRLRARTNNLVKTVMQIWHKHASDDFDTAVVDAMTDLLTMLDAAQYATASDAIAYTRASMQRQIGARMPARWNITAAQWVGVNGNGMPTWQTLAGAAIKAKQAVSEGMPTTVALQRAGVTLVIRSRTALADTYRGAAESTARAIRYDCGYVRALNPPSCGRCILLAGQPCGRVPFERHPQCDCIAEWTPNGIDRSMLASPGEYLDSLDDQQLARVLGSRANARAYRDGADINQLINAYRRKGSVGTAQQYGRTVKYTTEGTTRRGSAAWRMRRAGYAKEYVKQGGRYTKLDRPRLMPETIYQIAGGDQERAKTLLRNYGWIL